jgi:quercetin dioxygenase-like cupin family protein
MESKIFLEGDAINWEDQGGGISRQILGYNDQIMMVKVKFIRGSAGSAHSHRHSQTTYVESGKFEFTVGEEKKTIVKGDAVYISPDVAHSALCIEEGILIDAFSPMRKDFINDQTVPYSGLIK